MCIRDRYIHLLYLKDYLKNQFKLTFLDFTLLSRVLSKDKDALTLKDLIDSIRFMYPQVVRAINKLNEKDLLTKERFLADERIVLVRTNKKQLDFAINIIKDISKILNKKSFC
ncbi:transcriptional regulator, SarA/Rot family, partial [Staphylococcus simiae]|uniref:transcriptional regulator, SarA/Rot family n=1 Tax=Staphylococcus simiae TaxID=308354 RepID=UPI00387E950A